MIAQDCRDVIEWINAVQGDLDLTSFQRSVLEGMGNILHADRGSFTLCCADLDRLDVATQVYVNLNHADYLRYRDHYFRFDPAYKAACFTPKIVYKIDDLVPESRFLKGRYYNDFLRPVNIRYELDTYLRSGASILGKISFFRGREEPNFNEEDITTAKTLSPYIISHLRNSVILSRIQGETRLFRNVFESLSRGVIILDSELRPRYSNSKAKEICLLLSDRRANSIYKMDGRELPIPHDILRDCMFLKRRIMREDIKADAKPQITVHENGNRRFRIELSAVRCHLQGQCIPHFLVYLDDISETNSGRGMVGTPAYHLTRREIDIVKHVSEGLTNKDISEVLSISERTVDTHLRNIFLKMEVRNRTELVTHCRRLGLI